MFNHFNIEDKPIHRNAVLKKLLQILTSCSVLSVKRFLQNYNIELKKETEQQISSKLEKLQKVLLDDESVDKTEEALKNVEDNAKTLVFTFLCAAIETTWKEYGVDINTHSVVKSTKIIKQKRDKVREQLYDNIDKNFKELDILIASIVPEPKDGLEGILNNVVGFK